jgi:hypothetical protein
MDRDVENHTSDVGHDKQESWPELIFNKIIPLNETGLGGLRNCILLKKKEGGRHLVVSIPIKTVSKINRYFN